MVDLTVAAIPFYFGSMGAEHLRLRRTAERGRPVGAGDYERRDTVASLSMGVGSLVVPLVLQRVLRPVTPGRGRWGKALVGVAVGAAAVTTAADVIARRSGDGPLEAGVIPGPRDWNTVADRSVGSDRALGAADADRTGGSGRSVGVSADVDRTVTVADVTTDPILGPRAGADGSTAAGTAVTGASIGAGTAGEPGAVGPGRARRRRIARAARRVASSGAVTAVAAGVTAGATTWAWRTAAETLWRKSGHRRDLGAGVLPTAAAILGWDAIYYWNHRLMHESRFLWAIHVVHHSSERYNLSTALRQPVADSFGIFVPMGLLSALGIRPSLIETARGVNLLYQFWIHTETIPRLGPLEEVLNTPSHHRVHHGSNRRYLDRNHGSILIVWDRLFGTFQREDDDEPVVYGLTRNIDTFNPLRIGTHEHADILRDVAASETWADRLGFVFRGPGWAYDRRRARAELAAGADPGEPPATVAASAVPDHGESPAPARAGVA